MKNLFCIFVILSSILGGKAFSNQEQEIYCLSTPRSGTHWSLYTICNIFDKRVVFNRGVAEVDIFYSRFQENQGIIYGAHNPKDLWIRKNGYNTDFLILILRNYRECMYRDCESVNQVLNEIENQAKFNNLYSNIKAQICLRHQNHYFNNLKCYDLWDPSKRFLIRYEDMIENPEKVISELLEFFDRADASEVASEFLRNIEYHKKECFNIYRSQGGSKSGGSDPLFYTKKMGYENARLIDKEVKHKFPYMFNTYLRQYELK